MQVFNEGVSVGHEIFGEFYDHVVMVRRDIGRWTHDPRDSASMQRV